MKRLICIAHRREREEMLTKARLENHYHLAGEIGDIERQLIKLEGRATFTYGGDTILDYRSGYPVPQLIGGYGWSDATHKKRQQLIGKLSVKRGELIRQKMQLEEELENVQEAAIRRIIRLRYFDRLSWDAVAIAIDGTKSGDAMRKRLDKFLGIS